MRIAPLVALQIVLLAAPASAQHGLPAPPPAQPAGWWEAPFDHDLTGFEQQAKRFNALHMALVPRGPLRGRVIVWDGNSDQTGARWIQRWAIVDPEAPGGPLFHNGELALPADQGDLFCAGLAWSADSQLLVAGGTGRYSGNERTRHDPFRGCRLAYLWEPGPEPTGHWRRLHDLLVDRWYPTVVRAPSGDMLVAGGLQVLGLPMRNDYEVYRVSLETRPHALPAARRPSYPGPSLPASPLLVYPRLQVLRTGELFLSGMGAPSARLDPDGAPGLWTPMDEGAWELLQYVGSVVLPAAPDAPDEVLVLGGEVLGTGVVDTVESCRPGAAGAPDWDWIARAPLLRPRVNVNAVLLPDRSVLVIGGRSSPQGVPEEWVAEPELLYPTPAGLGRRLLAPMASPRTYHSTAVLLPSGKVLSAGGNSATFDYQVFVPPCLTTGRARPRLLAAPEHLTWGEEATVSYGFGRGGMQESFGHLVLIAPGSATHHWDSSQRYVEIETLAVTDDEVRFRAPPDVRHASRGDYLLFLVSAAGVPSIARWVELR